MSILKPAVIRFGIIVLVAAVLPVWAQDSAVDNGNNLGPDEVVLDKKVFFAGPDGKPVIAEPGSFWVSRETDKLLRLTPPEGNALVIKAVGDKHKEDNDVAIAIAEPWENDAFHIVLFQPDGTSLDARGSLSGVQSRAVRGWSPTTAYRINKKAVYKAKQTSYQQLKTARVYQQRLRAARSTVPNTLTKPKPKLQMSTIRQTQAQPAAEFKQNNQLIDYSKYDNKKVNFRGESGQYLAANYGPFGPVTVANRTSKITQFETYLQGKDLFVRSTYRTYLTAAGNGLQLRAFSGVPSQVWRLIPKAGSNPLRFYLQSVGSKYLTYDQAAKKTQLLPFSEQATSAWLISEQASTSLISSPGAIQQPLSALISSKWPTNSIPVCWENAAPANLQQRTSVRNAVENSWEAQSCVNFTGWQTCQKQDDGIRILIEDSNPLVRGLGSNLDGWAEGMVLNFTFEEWGPACANPLYNQKCIRSNAIHEFGHALGFSHEHNRTDCTTVEVAGDIIDWAKFCTDEPQGETGDWNITACDAGSIMNYCWNSSYNGRLSQLDIDGVKAMYGSCSGPGEEFRDFRPQAVGPLCPSSLESGDRDFNGNGPRMRVDVNLRISDDRNELWADIDFFAAEYNPSDPFTLTDPTTVKQRFSQKLWSEPGTTIVAFESDNISSTVETTSPPGGFEISCGDPLAGAFKTPVDETGLVRSIEMIGDTGGNDVSTDSNCDCDMQIRSIEFNSIKLRVRRD